MADDDANTRVVTLEDTGWGRLLFALLSQRFTGRAELDQDGTRRSIVFDGGFAIWTDYDVPNTGLSEILASAGMLADDEAAALRQHAPDDSLDAFARAVADGTVDAETAAMAMRDQCEQRLIATAGRRGELALRDEIDLPSDALDHLEPARTLRVINFGVRNHCSPDRAERALEHLEDVDLEISHAYGKYGERFGFDSGEKGTLQLLGDRASFKLDDLLQISGLDAVRGVQLLYTLWSCNMLVEAGSESDVSAQDVSGGHSESSLVQELVVAKIETGAPAYEVLALAQDATLDEIDTAMDELAAKVAGEVAGASLEELRTRAYVQREMAARTIARKALADRRWSRAVSALRDVQALRNDELPVALDLAWAVWNDEERRGDAQMRALDEAITACGEQDDDVLARAMFYRGHVRKHQGRAKEALAAFDRAAELDPRLLDAQREARALSGSAQTSGKQSKASRGGGKAPSKAQPKPIAGVKSKYWTGAWPYIWVFAGIMLAVMVGAQVLLRLDREF
ncbi:MAG: hypothetical protein ACE37F_34840 [Nannocystaceae bacterium]|nr:tetratricopeptide repeat protein [bacterium]